MKIRHVGIDVENMEKMLEYYGSKGKIVYDEVEKVRVVKIKMEDSTVELRLWHPDAQTMLRHLGISHVAFTQDPEGNMIEMVTPLWVGE